MRCCIISILLTVITGLSVCPAHSAQRVALVIGNGEYSSAPLKNPVNDANDMSATLADLGFEVITETDATKRGMIAAIDRFSQKLSRAEIGLFYYAGHGMQINGRNYLIPVQVSVNTESDVEFEAVDAGRILGKMRQAGNKLNVVVLDACRNNPFSRTFRTSTQGLARMDAPVGTIVAYATSPGSIAADGDGRNGIYTKHLLSALKKTGLDIQNIFNEAGMGVMAETGNTQVPWTSNTPIPRYYLAGGAPGHVVGDGGSIYALGETGSLRVSSRPSGAEVLINGTNVGKSPLILDRIHTGFMKVTIAKDSYKAGVKEILVMAGETVVIDLELERAATTGTLTVQAKPVDARVRIVNIKPVYKPGMELEAGRYHVEVSADAYEKQVQWLEIAAGEDKQVPVELEKIKQAPELAVASTVSPQRNYTDPTTGMEFVLVPGGCYQMGQTPADMQTLLSSVGAEQYNKYHGDESPRHNVCVDAFYMGKYEVTAQGAQTTTTEVSGIADDRFVDNGDGTVTDMQSGLMWAADDNGKNVNWAAAQKYCATFRGGGLSDWRMPTLTELSELFGAGISSIDYPGNHIIRINDWHIWSNFNSQYSWARKLDFSNGTSMLVRDNSRNAHALPVRNSN